VSNKNGMEHAKLNIAAIRRRANYSRIEYILRFSWSIVSIFFRNTPRLAYPLRNWLLRIFGAKIGARVTIYPSCKVFLPWMLTIGDDTSIADGVGLYCLGPLSVGNRVVISQNAYLCGGTHDFESTNFTLVRAPIVIEDDCWICAGAFIGPNVTIGARSVVGAMSAVFKDCQADSVYGGNPAQRIKTRVFND